MDITERMKSFYERWNMTMDTKADAKAFQKRALYSLEITMCSGINDNRARDIYHEYFKIIGKRVALRKDAYGLPIFLATILEDMLQII
jgi:hypothetical protein